MRFELALKELGRRAQREIIKIELGETDSGLATFYQVIRDRRRLQRSWLRRL